MPSAAGRHVWWIILENHEYGAIIGNDQARYLSSLADHYGLATNYFAISHPSEPNYVALVAGSTLGVSSDGTYNLAGPSLFDQLRAARLTWRVYAQDYPGGCFTGPEARGGQDGPGVSGAYVRKHNPAISFKSVTGSPAQCGNIQPLRDLDPAAGAFEMIVPNLINDMHDGSVAQGDAFMRQLVPQIVASPAFASGGVLFVTFDEGGSNAGSLGDHGGRVATLIIASDVTPGYRDGSYLDHWSLLRTTESLLGVACLGDTVALFSEGQLIALAGPDALRREAMGGEIIEIDTASMFDAEVVREVPLVREVHQRSTRSFFVTTDEAGAALPPVLAAIEAAGGTVTSSREYRPSFDEIFATRIERHRASLATPDPAGAEPVPSTAAA